MLKRFAIFFLLLLIVFFSLQCNESQQGRVTLLHTNDMHSQYVPLKATWLEQEPKPLIGGMVALDYYIRQQRESYPHSLLLDAGDFCTGTPLSKIEYKGAQNGGFVEMMNLIGYDAVTIGNHEFDEGQKNLRKLLALLNCDVLSSNLFVNEKMFADQSFKIYKAGDLRIGVIGVMLKNLAGMAARKNLGGITVKDPAPVVQSIIDKIDSKTDLIIVLTHQGRDEDVSLAEQLGRADVIVGGHSHTRINEAMEINSMLIVQAGSKTHYLGRLTMDVAGDTVANYEYELIPTWVKNVEKPDPHIKALVDTFQQRIDAEYNEHIGTLAVDWHNHNFQETGPGNFICDAMRAITGTDIAILNSGGIRKSLSAGPITKLDVVEILPFTNYVVTFDLTGEQLLRLIRDNIHAAMSHDYSIVQISGFSYAYRVNNSSGDLVFARVNDEPLQPGKTYSCTSVDYLYDQLTERYDYSFTNFNQEATIIADLVIDYIKAHPDITTSVEGRIQKVKE